MAVFFFYQGNNLSKEVWVGHEWKPKLLSRGHGFFFHKNKIIHVDKILAVRLEGLFWTRSKMGCSFFLWTLGSAFGLGLWRLHTMAIQVERPWEFMAKGLDFGHGV
jgi:hypothetical protein